MFLFILLFFACLGSFCACYIYRFLHNEDIIFDRSRCPHCKHTLAWWQLLPVISYLLLKGKCHYCKSKISLYYPLHEMLYIVVGCYVYWICDDVGLILLYGLYFSLNYVLSYIDYQTQLVPNHLLLLLLVVVIVLFHPTIFQYGIALGYLLLLTMLYFLKPNQLGYGDVLYICIHSLSMSYIHTSFAILFACILAIIYIIKRESSQIPFIPFLMIGFILLHLLS